MIFVKLLPNPVGNGPPSLGDAIAKGAIGRSPIGKGRYGLYL